MATFFVRVTPIKRSQGRSVVACSAYRAGTRLRDERLGLTFDYSHKSKRSEIVAEGVMLPEGAAAWMADRARLWNELEAMEKRKDARPAREILIALPHELSDEQRHQLLREFLAEHVVARGMIADYAIHQPTPGNGRADFDPTRDPDPRNHHAHVLVTTRAIVTENGEVCFGGKPQEWNGKSVIFDWRKGWAEAANLPELRDGVNCLLGGSGREIAEAIVRAVRDPELRLRLGRAARTTYEETFHPSVAGRAIVERLERLARVV